MRVFVLLSVGLMAACNDATHTPVSAIFGGDVRTCALVADGSLYCWGGRFEPPYLAVDAAPMRFGTAHWRTVAVGSSHACGIRNDGTLWCWGRNCAGQLGDGTRDLHPEPIQVGTRSDWSKVATGGGHSCAIDDAGVLTCWGGPDYGESDCSTTPSQAPTAVDGNWTAVSSNIYSIHAIRSDGTLWRMLDESRPPGSALGALEQVGAATWRAIASGLFDGCGVRADRSLACVANNATVETPVGADRDWTDLLAARDHACAIRDDGSLWCWGRNDMGQLGRGSVGADALDPVRVGSDHRWTGVTAGFAFSCGIRAGSAYCWGTGRYGELGAGTTDDAVHAPAPIAL